MFPYNNRLVDYVASFPAAVYAPKEVRNLNPDGELLTETGTVPASADFEGKRRLNLDQVPQEQVGITVTVAGSARALVPYGEAPAVGQVALSMATGVLEFHASDAGLAVSVTYRGKGTPLMAFLFHQLGKELQAVQTKALELDGLLSGLGTMAQQNANAVNITGGTINGTNIGQTNAGTARFSQLNITNIEQGSPGRWVALNTEGADYTLTSPISSGAGMPISIGGTGATTAAGARTNLGLGSAAERDANAFTNRPLVITVSGNATRNLLASESGAMVLMDNSAVTNTVNLPAGPPNGTYYWIRVISGGSIEQIVTSSGNGFASNDSIDGFSMVGSTGANFATMLVLYVAADDIWHVLFNDGWTNPI